MDKPVLTTLSLSLAARGNRLLRSRFQQFRISLSPRVVHSACKKFRARCAASHPEAMEALPGVALASPSCSISQCSSKSCRSSPPHVSIPPSGFAASLFGSLIASVPPSLAVNYNDIVTQGDPAPPASGIDFSNPALLFAGVAVAVAAPLIAFRLANPQSFGSASPLTAFAALEEQNVQLLDIRAPEDARASGSPNLKALRKKAVQVTYRSDDSFFVDKVLAKYRDAENTTLYVLDERDGNALIVAKLLANSGFEKAFAIAGGVEEWQRSELPWLEPRKGFNLNVDGLKNLLSTSDNPNLVPATLGAVAAAGIGIAVFTEAETVLQLLGSAAFIQIFARKFMFADDREKTLKEIKTFLDTKIAPKEFATELKEVGKALIPEEEDEAVKNEASVTPDKVNANVSIPELKVADQA